MKISGMYTTAHRDLDAVYLTDVSAQAYSADLFCNTRKEALEKLLMPKLLLVTSGLGLGGAEALLIDFALMARSRGWRVNIASLSADGHHRDTLLNHGFDVSDYGMRRGVASVAGLRRSVAAVRSSDADIVQCWMYHANFVGGLSTLGTSKRPVYFGIFSSIMDFSKYNALTRLTFEAGAKLSRRSAGVVYNGTRAASDHEKAGYRDDRTITIGNSVDFGRFRPDEERRRAIREELGLSDSQRVVVVAARNDPQKDWKSMLEVAHQSPDIVLLATGLGTESLDVPANVVKLGARRDIEAIYSASDVFMLLSNFGEGTSVAMSEAMSTGLPVVTTDVGDNAMIIGEDAGIVVPLSDGAVAAKAINDIFSNDDRRRTMSSVALERSRTLCAPEAAFAPLWDSYEQVLR